MPGRNVQNEGEGSRTADKKYREGVSETLKYKDVDKLAEEAKQAYEHDDGELARAEAIGRAKADEAPTVDARIVDLARLRDEVRVRIHLANLEAKDVYEKLEDRFMRLVGKAGAVKDASTKGVSDVAAATSLVIEELKEGYERLKREITR